MVRNRLTSATVALIGQSGQSGAGHHLEESNGKFQLVAEPTTAVVVLPAPVVRLRCPRPDQHQAWPNCAGNDGPRRGQFRLAHHGDLPARSVQGTDPI